jgi:hypothetical protein
VLTEELDVVLDEEDVTLELTEEGVLDAGLVLTEEALVLTEEVLEDAVPFLQGIHTFFKYCRRFVFQSLRKATYAFASATELIL